MCAAVANTLRQRRSALPSQATAFFQRLVIVKGQPGVFHPPPVCRVRSVRARVALGSEAAPLWCALEAAVGACALSRVPTRREPRAARVGARLSGLCGAARANR
eukprot:6397838-Prymnesium_polylepis.1